MYFFKYERYRYDWASRVQSSSNGVVELKINCIIVSRIDKAFLAYVQKNT